MDEYRLMVHPVLVGSGKRIFNAGSERSLELASMTRTSTGVVVLTYGAASE